MIIEHQKFNVKGLNYSIRSATLQDAEALSLLRVQIDGETENMDREQGEAHIDAAEFEKMIRLDTEKPKNLFLVAVVRGQVVGYSRCEGRGLERFSHKVEFGVGVAKEFWGYGMGQKMLALSIHWAEISGVEKMSLNVLGTNDIAIGLYKRMGFEIEGVLKKDRRHADGRYYDTILMGRFSNESREES